MAAPSVGMVSEMPGLIRARHLELTGKPKRYLIEQPS
jgi:hypothetical protein